MPKRKWLQVKLKSTQWIWNFAKKGRLGQLNKGIMESNSFGNLDRQNSPQWPFWLNRKK